MGNKHRSSDGVTRRTVLLGAVGAAALGLVKERRALAAGPAVDPGGDAAPYLAAPKAAVAVDLPPRQPGFQYAAYSQYDFQPQLSASGRTNSAFGSYCPNHSGLTENLIAPLHLPDGAVLHSVVWTVFNSYTAQSVYLGYRPHSGEAGKDVWVVVPPNPAVLQVAVVTPSPAWSIDNTAGAYFLWIPTGIGSGWQVSVWSARVAYTTPSLLFMPLIQR